jgi:Glycosyl transferase family 2
MPELPSVSVIFPTTHPWPEIEPCLDAVVPEARELGAEVVVVDRDGRGLPADAAQRYPGVVHLSEAGASIYRLRDIALSAATGDVVAITEDHCRPGPRWLERHARAHAEHPDVAAVGGPVANGATGTLTDWAIFLTNHAPWTPPARSGRREKVDRANISYKRRVLPRVPSPLGWNEPVMDERLAARGERMWFDATNPVTHDQALGLRGTLTIVFHNGRACAGLHVERRMSPVERLLRIPASPLVIPIILRRVLGAVARRPRAFPARALASLALVPALSVSTALGYLVAYVAGPGESAQHIH